MAEALLSGGTTTSDTTCSLPSACWIVLCLVAGSASAAGAAVLNNLNVLERSEFEQILYTNADGSVLVLTYLQPGTNATIVHDGRDTSIPWSRYIAVAAW